MKNFLKKFKQKKITTIKEKTLPINSTINLTTIITKIPFEDFGKEIKKEIYINEANEVRFFSELYPDELFDTNIPAILVREKRKGRTSTIGSAEQKMVHFCNSYSMQLNDFEKWSGSKFTPILGKKIQQNIKQLNEGKYQEALIPVFIKFETTFSILATTINEILECHSEIPESMKNKILQIILDFDLECQRKKDGIDHLEFLDNVVLLKSLEERVDFELQYIGKVLTNNNV
jgi:hypothetical protein